MNDRRKFVRNFGLLGAVFAGMGSAEAARRGLESNNHGTGVVSNGSPVDISHLRPLGTTKISLLADNEPPKPASYSQSGYTISLGQGSQSYVVTSSPKFEEQNKVNLSVGKDNRLWVEVDGKWHRVALEA